jgi:hypothetical protein
VPLDDRERVDIVEARIYYRCPRCEAWFLIRWDDAVALGVVPPGMDRFPPNP